MKLISGDCIEAMRDLADESVDAIVTDPPYGLGFMGKAWDDLPPGEEWGRECLRVLKPGGHLLAFGGSRTYHRLACAVEDAGFEVRDQMMWLYGSGFPKSLDVSKAIDKAAGVEFEAKPASGVGFMNAEGRGGYNVTRNRLTRSGDQTPEAKTWNGWGTALKPAHEPIVVARKPLAGTVAENVLRFGTGALNIDGCRIGTDDTTTRRNSSSSSYLTGEIGAVQPLQDPYTTGSTAGRWPANVVLDEEAGRLLDEQSGDISSQKTRNKPTGGTPWHGTGLGTVRSMVNYGDTGGASRFFYCAKASRGERNAGLDGFEGKRIAGKGNGMARTCASCGASVLDGCDCPDRTYENPVRANHHPTVKPISLMRYLVRLVTPPEGTVLDPFLGSGTTGCAAVLEGFDFIGIEREPEYLAIAEARIAWWEKHRGDGETAEILKAAGVRDEVEASGQLGLLEDAA